MLRQLSSDASAWIYEILRCPCVYIYVCFLRGHSAHYARQIVLTFCEFGPSTSILGWRPGVPKSLGGILGHPGANPIILGRYF